MKCCCSCRTLALQQCSTDFFFTPCGTSVRPVRECVCPGGSTQQDVKCSLLLRSMVIVNVSAWEVTVVRPCNLVFVVNNDCPFQKLWSGGFWHRVVTCVYFDVSEGVTRCLHFYRVCFWYRCMLKRYIESCDMVSGDPSMKIHLNSPVK